jgi:hypothetical protein
LRAARKNFLGQKWAAGMFGKKMGWWDSPEGYPTIGNVIDTLKASAFKNLKELRIQYQGEPWRILFAFDPKRQAILLVGGNKTGNDRWYQKNIPIAEERYSRYLETLEEES